jgi:hypothetical protein
MDSHAVTHSLYSQSLRSFLKRAEGQTKDPSPSTPTERTVVIIIIIINIQRTTVRYENNKIKNKLRLFFLLIITSSFQRYLLLLTVTVSLLHIFYRFLFHHRVYTKQSSATAFLDSFHITSNKTNNL